MDSFCDGNRFWDTDLTWRNNSWPQLTDCFQNTALTWGPCGILLVATPVYMAYLRSLAHTVQTVNLLFLLKQVFTTFMIIINVIDLGKVLDESDDFNDYTLVPIFWIGTMFLHMLLVNLERQRNVSRSYLLFFFWILGSAGSLVQFSSAIQLEIYEEDVFRFALLSARYALTCLIFVLYCFSGYQGLKTKDIHPMIFVSIPSRLTFSWFDRFLLRAYKTPIQNKDIFPLFPQDRSKIVVKELLTKWKHERNRHQRKRTKRRGPSVTSVKTPLLQEKAHELNESSPSLQYKSFEDAHSRTSQLSWNARGKDGDNRISKPSLWMTLIKTFWVETLVAHSGQLVFLAMTALNPVILGWFIDYVNSEELIWHGYIYALALILSNIITTAFTISSYFSVVRISTRIHSAIIGAVFRKTLTISNEARKQSTAGEIINFMSVDAGHIKMMMDSAYWIWLGLAFFIIGIYLTYTIVGLAMLAGFGFIAVMMVINIVLSRKMKKYQFEMMLIKDERIKIMNEILNGIQVIKLYGWEPMFMKRVLDIRDRELNILFKINLLTIFSTFSWNGSMFWMNFLTLITYVFLNNDHYLDANTTFVSYNYIAMVRLAVNLYPRNIRDTIKAATSVERLRRFFNSDDINPKNLTRDTSDDLAARIVNGDFSWEKQESLTLKGINLKVNPGQLIAIVGPVGCGKSSLLSALLGEMNIRNGRANLNSSVAYVPQQAWIQNDTLRNNVLFGRPFQHQFYQQTLDACALGPDLDKMPARDETEIGEKGINLSGGQKQRVSLARAVFSAADIYLLDDPLSAVDSHVGRHIFNHVIGNSGCLKSKSRLLVTHGTHWLPHVDHIIVMADGQIAESGSFEQLISHKGAFADFLSQYFSQHSNHEDQNVASEDEQDILKRLISVTSDSEANDETEALVLQNLLASQLSHDLQTSHDQQSSKHSLTHSQKIAGGSETRIQSTKDVAAQGRLTTDEKQSGGNVTWKMYIVLAKGLGYVSAAVTLFLVLVNQVFLNAANIWLAQWNDDSNLANFTSHPADSSQREDLNNHYIIIYAIFGVLQTLGVLGYAIVLYCRAITASRKLHFELLNSIMRAPMLFFDATPMGRILNRFSQDIETLDNDVFVELDVVLDHGLKALGILITISVTIPAFIGVCVPIIVIMYFIQVFYTNSACQLRSLSSNNRSPVYAHFSEVLSGVSVIRAYKAQDRFIAQSNAKVDKFQRCNFGVNVVNRWIQTRLDMSIYIVIIGVSIFAIVLRDDLSPGIIGLVISYALRLTIEISMCIMDFGTLQTQIVNVQRIREYSGLESEAPWTMKVEDERVSKSWPQLGQIQFIDYSTKYRPGQDFVLKGISCSVKGGEKVGIVGRTGAGKSSMVLSLFRLIESWGGQIIIDGVDIAHIGLHTLRRHLTILPQDPILFAGSLRFNLDPFDEKSDEELWNALEHAHLKQFVQTLDGKLDYEIVEGGENLSVGQRQLVCLARTLLRKTKVLVLDEATAAVDMETDALIQDTIRREFSGCTILTIAHRLNTILDYDRVMVLQSGQILEFDSPSNLMANENSAFFAMAKKAGIVAAAGKE